MRPLFNFISWIFHPMLMVLYGALLYLFALPSDFSFPDPSIPIKIIGLLLIGTVMMPVMGVVIMLRVGGISSLGIEEKKERNWPLLMSTIIYVGAYYALRSRAVPDFIQLFLLGSIAAMIIALLVNLGWKISLHMIGIGGLCGALAVLYVLGVPGSPLLLAFCFVLAGLLGSARFGLASHNLLQIGAGFAAGFGVEFLFLYFSLR